MFSVYVILNRVNGKVYVGQTKKSVRARWNDHVSLAKQNPKYFFSNAIRKYGRDAFSVSEVCAVSSQEEADLWERRFIENWSSDCREFGYNSTSGGVSNYRLSAKVRQELHAHNKGVLGRADVPTEEIVRLYKDGVSCSDIADRTGLGQMTVYRRLKKNDTKVRPHTVSFPIEEASGLYKKGATGQILAEKYGVSVYTVYRHLRKSGVDVRSSPVGELRPNPVPLQNIVSLYNEGLSCAAIAGKFGVTQSGISARLRKAGTKMRHSGFVRKIK